MRTHFKDFFWLCGSSRAGKSTTSSFLEKEYGFYIYHFDDEVFGKLWKTELDPEKFPLTTKLIQNNNDWEKYYSRSIEHVISESIDIFKENWPLVLEDIKKIDTNKPVLIEGGGMLPDWVSSVASKDRILFLIPTKRFQRLLFEKGMILQDGEEPTHEGQFFHAYKDTKFIVDQRIDHHDGIALKMVEEAKILGIKYSMVDCHDDFKKNSDIVIKQFISN